VTLCDCRPPTHLFIYLLIYKSFIHQKTGSIHTR